MGFAAFPAAWNTVSLLPLHAVIATAHATTPMTTYAQNRFAIGFAAFDRGGITTVLCL
jgi:hypothetical protein